MILVDKDLKQRGKEIFGDNFKLSQVNNISYELTIAEIITSEGSFSNHKLLPNEIIQVRCTEKINMPYDLIGRVVDKNSMIRLGLSVSSPVYQPGHDTYVFFRIQNVSANAITLKKDDVIAQMMFEQLTQKPETPYDSQQSASFNKETVYRGLGNYKNVYEQRIEKYNEVKENLDKKENSIYANIMTLMGIFVSVFSLITVNFSAINNQNFSSDLILVINLSLGIVITLFIGLILIFINKFENKYFNWLYFIVMGVLIALLCFIIL